MLIPLSPILESERFLEQEFFRQVRDFLTITTTATLDFPNTAANLTSDLTVSLRGVKSGDTVIATPPSTIEAGLTWCAFISANDFVKVRILVSGAGAVDPAPALWRITVFRY